MPARCPPLIHRVDIALSDGLRILVDGATALSAIVALVMGLAQGFRSRAARGGGWLRGSRIRYLSPNNGGNAAGVARGPKQRTPSDAAKDGEEGKWGCGYTGLCCTKPEGIHIANPV